MSETNPSVTTGAQALAQMLDGYGVTHIFHVPAVLRSTMAELEKVNPSIARIHAHGEKSAVYMADGYTRASGRPGVCAAQIIGAMNLAAGLREPWLAHSPVIALTGGRDPKTKFKKVYQEIDDVPAFEQVTKFNATVDDVERIPDMLRQAYRSATTGEPGPVHLQFQGNEGQLDKQTGTFDTSVEPMFAAVPPFRPQSEDGPLLAAIEKLAAAERPLIVAGGGVRASGAAAEVIALAESLSIPIVTSLNGRDGFVGSHPLVVGVVGTYSRQSANKVMRRADLVFFIGTETGGMTTHFWSLPQPGTAAIQLDLNPENIGRNYSTQVAINGDAKAVVARMVTLAQGTAPAHAEWLAEAARANAEWREQNDAVLTSDDAPTRPERICGDLSKFLPDDSIVVVDTGHAGMWMGGYYDLRTPQQSYLRSCGHLGWALPAGMGAKAGAPDRPTVVFTGDAGAWYHIGELETAVRWKLNSVTVVNNNSGGNQSKRGFDTVYGGQQTPGGRSMWTFTDVNFADLAENVGAFRHPGREAVGLRAGARARDRSQPPGGHRRPHRHRGRRTARGFIARC